MCFKHEPRQEEGGHSGSSAICKAVGFSMVTVGRSRRERERLLEVPFDLVLLPDDDDEEGKEEDEEERSGRHGVRGVRELFCFCTTIMMRMYEASAVEM